MAEEMNNQNTNANTGQNTEPNTQTEPKGGAEPEKKYSDADLDKIIGQKYAKWSEKTDKAIEDAKAEAVKLAKMNAEQKAAYESEQKDLRIAEMEAQLQKIALGKVAGEILKEQGMDATQDILDMVVGTTAEDTKTQVEAFVKLVNAQVEIRERQRATGTTPKSYTGAEPLSEIEQRIARFARCRRRTEEEAANHYGYHKRQTESKAGH